MPDGFDCAGFLRKLDSIHGYAIPDITMFPEVPCWLVQSRVVRNWWDPGKLGTTSEIPRLRALELLPDI